MPITDVLATVTRRRESLEISESKELIRLPPSQQASFYQQEIVPLEQKATRAADQEIQMMREAEKAGIEWPSDLQELTKNKTN